MPRQKPTETQLRHYTLDRMLEACVTGKECRINAGEGYGRPPAISPGGLGQLKRFNLWPEAMRQIAGLAAVHPDAKLRWLKLWSRISFRSHVTDDDLFYCAMRVIMPRSCIGTGVTVYRGQAIGAPFEPSWARQPHIALKFAFCGVDNVDAVKLAISGVPPDAWRRKNPEFVTAFAPPDAIICDAYRFGHSEGEYIVEPRKLIGIKRQPAMEIAPWVRDQTVQLLARIRPRER